MGTFSPDSLHRIGHAFLIAKVGQGHQEAHRCASRFWREQLGADLGVRTGLDAAQLRVRLVQDDRPRYPISLNSARMSARAFGHQAVRERNPDCLRSPQGHFCHVFAPCGTSGLLGVLVFDYVRLFSPVRRPRAGRSSAMRAESNHHSCSCAGCPRWKARFPRPAQVMGVSMRTGRTNRGALGQPDRQQALGLRAARRCRSGCRSRAADAVQHIAGLQIVLGDGEDLGHQPVQRDHVRFARGWRAWRRSAAPRCCTGGRGGTGCSTGPLPMSRRTIASRRRGWSVRTMRNTPGATRPTPKSTTPILLSTPPSSLSAKVWLRWSRSVSGPCMPRTSGIRPGGVGDGGHLDHRLAAIDELDQHVGAQAARAASFCDGRVGGRGVPVERVVFALAGRHDGEAHGDRQSRTAPCRRPAHRPRPGHTARPSAAHTSARRGPR